MCRVSCSLTKRVEMANVALVMVLVLFQSALCDNVNNPDQDASGPVTREGKTAYLI